jgi:group II intron reverse transcriptase/maturase
MNDIQLTQHSFAKKAMHNSQHRFADLYHFLYRKEWIELALQAVLRNTGSRTAGVDGITRRDFDSEKFRAEFIAQLQQDLKRGAYYPQPVRRHWIPKPSGEKRGLGIPTIRDRTVQMLLKMLMEPIFESDFLDCSKGFRPGRRTMDCIAECYAHIHSGHKYFWVIEGDIRKCFDRVQHETLLHLVERRIDDRRIVKLLRAFLKAGVMEDGLVSPSLEGVPQGGIISPLLTNIYLHELDSWWWEEVGRLSNQEKSKRRRNGQANYRLARYADDFIILTNGTKEQALAIRDAVQEFLKERLHLELNLEKTRVTHATDGFDFLGFHIQYMRPRDSKPWLRVTPSEQSIARLKAKIKEMTSRQRVHDTPLHKVMAINRVLRGWITYYRHVSVKRTATKLDWWIGQCFVGWLEDKHKLGYRRIKAMYEVQETKSRKNYGVRDTHGELVCLFKMADVRLTPYRRKKKLNPYLLDSLTYTTPPIYESEAPLAEHVWLGQSSQSSWHEIRYQILERDGYRCQRCNSRSNLDVHHRTARKDGGHDAPDNLVTLCRQCHTETESWGEKSA